eukprot:447922_1
MEESVKAMKLVADLKIANEKAKRSSQSTQQEEATMLKRLETQMKDINELRQTEISLTKMVDDTTVEIQNEKAKIASVKSEVEKMKAAQMESREKETKLVAEVDGVKSSLKSSQEELIVSKSKVE